MVAYIWDNISSANGLFAWRHLAITWTNVDLSSVTSHDIHVRSILQVIPQPSITKISSKITYLRFHSSLPGANEFINDWHDKH